MSIPNDACDCCYVYRFSASIIRFTDPYVTTVAGRPFANIVTKMITILYKLNKLIINSGNRRVMYCHYIYWRKTLPH